jgi:hypothetical protein
MSFAFTAAKLLALLRHYSSRPYLTPAQKTVRSLLSAKPEKTFEINEATEIASYKLPHRRVCRIHGCYTNFLKHYEECGLLDVHHRENGYRYFNFDQCSRILEYMRLRNYDRIKTLQREISRLANQTRNAKHFLTVPGVGDTIMAYMCAPCRSNAIFFGPAVCSLSWLGTNAYGQWRQDCHHKDSRPMR